MTELSVLRIETFQGNTLYYPVIVRQYANKTPLDLSLATAVHIEWERSDDVSQPIVNVLPSVPGADWPEGLLMLPFTPADFTAEIGPCTFSLTIFIGGQEVTYATGTVDVAERPGWPPPA